MLNLLQQAMTSEDAAADPTVLGAISAPVVVLVASDTKSSSYFPASARHVIDHVPHARIRELPGVGHAAPLTHPKALANALAEVFIESPEAQPQL